jgi:hypothetical protein
MLKLVVLGEMGPKRPSALTMYSSSSLSTLRVAASMAADDGLIRGAGTHGPRRGHGWKSSRWAVTEENKKLVVLRRTNNEEVCILCRCCNGGTKRIRGLPGRVLVDIFLASLSTGSDRPRHDGTDWTDPSVEMGIYCCQIIGHVVFVLRW